MTAAEFKSLDLCCYVAGDKRLPAKSTLFISLRWPLAALLRCWSRPDRGSDQSCIGSEIGAHAFQRSSILDSARALLEQRREEFAWLITSESGLCLRESRMKWAAPLTFFALPQWRRCATTAKYSRATFATRQSSQNFTLREPVGLVLAITPSITH